jgi:hypothetical protein
MSAGTLRPLGTIPASESNTGIADPSRNVSPVPDYTRVCLASGIDNSPACLDAVLAAINHAHALEGIRPMVLPTGFARLSIPDQLFVAVNLERVDRGLPAFGGLTTALNRNAQRGADDANDPPDPGQAYDLDDAEWAGGSSNGLDAIDTTGDTHSGDNRGTSMAVTLAVASVPVQAFTYSWAQVVAALPGGAA